MVDDDAPVRRLAMRMLGIHGYECSEATSEATAVEAVTACPPALVLTDIAMPGGSGISLVRRLRSSHPDVAAVMITARDDPATAEAALACGAYGYVIKPFEMNELLIAVSGALSRRTLALESRAHRDHLEELVHQRTKELYESRAETVERLARAVESRDPDTGQHLDRMSGLVFRIARGLGWAQEDANTLRLASILHDVGKVAVPDEILLKHGPLSVEERAIIETHVAIGHGILAGANSELLQLADTIAWTHHERFDGTGYPRGLTGEQIPLAGRIAAVADVFDALTSERPYHGALSEREALEVIHADHGLDPDVVAVLDAILGRHPAQQTGDTDDADPAEAMTMPRSNRPRQAPR